MTTQRKILIGVGVVAIIAVASALTLQRNRNRGVQVRAEEVARRDLVAMVTASGNIRARRAVEIQSDVMGRIIELNVDEGEDVESGRVLVRLDPTQYRAAVARAEAALSQARAQESQAKANQLQAQRSFERVREIRMTDSILVSAQEYEDAETQLEVQRALWAAARHGVEQAQAALDEARDRLSKTVIRAPISGKVTRLNVEEGETVIVGTMNNPGSLILTISDLSVMEAVVEVDETDVPEIALGDSAVVEIDAFPEEMFTGRVTEIGNSAIRPPSSFTGSQTASIDFEVVITLDDPPPELRPDLSATAEIVTDVRGGVLAIPIISLTVREPENGQEARDSVDREDPRAELLERGNRRQTVEEGVFVVREGEVTFTPVEIGITGQEYFEVVEGLSEGDSVVSGPYQTIRRLTDGDAVTVGEESMAEAEAASG